MNHIYILSNNLKENVQNIKFCIYRQRNLILHLNHINDYLVYEWNICEEQKRFVALNSEEFYTATNKYNLRDFLWRFYGLTMRGQSDRASGKLDNCDSRIIVTCLVSAFCASSLQQAKQHVEIQTLYFLFSEARLN